MAAPSLAVLDNFNRADGSLITGNWSNDTIGAGSSGATISSNQAHLSGVGAYGEVYWNPSTYGPNAEVYATWPTLGNSSHGLTISIQSPGSTAADGYRLQYSAGALSVIEVLNGGETPLGSTISYTASNGDAFALVRNGDDLEVYTKASGGSWTLQGTRTDSTYTSAGSIGMWMYDPGGAGRTDDFGGGTTSAAADQPLPLMVMAPPMPGGL